MATSDLNDEFDNEVSHFLLKELDQRYKPHGVTQSDTSTSGGGKVPELVVQNIKELLQHYSHGIPSLKLQKEYYNLFKSKIDFEKWGYENLSHMLFSNSKLFHLKNIDAQTKKKYPEYSNDIIVCDASDTKTVQIDYNLKIKLIRLIFKYSAEKKLFPIYRWIDLYRQAYNDPEFIFDQSDHVALFQTLAREFPIELYIDQGVSAENKEEESTRMEVTDTSGNDNVTNSNTCELLEQLSPPVVVSTELERFDGDLPYKLPSLDSIEEDEPLEKRLKPSSPQTMVVSNDIENITGLDGDIELLVEDELPSLRRDDSDKDEPNENQLKPSTPQVESNDMESIDVNAEDELFFLTRDDHDKDEPPEEQPLDEHGRILNICPTLCVRAKPLTSILNWRTKMVEEGHHKLIIDLYENSDKLPADVCLPGEKFANFRFPNDPVNDKSDLKVHRVVLVGASNPKHVYVNLIHNELDHLKNLNEEISDFFSSSGSKNIQDYIVPNEFIYPGFPCLTQVSDSKTGEKLWERSRIVGASPTKEDSIIVESVDYGAFHGVKYNELYLIPRKFVTLTAQAIHVSLIGVKPRDGKSRWSSDAGRRIRDFSWQDYHLNSIFSERHAKNDLSTKDNGKASSVKFPSYDVVFCDTHDPDMNIFLDEILVLECLADRDTNRSDETERLRQVLVEHMAQI